MMEEHLTILHELNLSLSEQVIPELCALMVSVASFDKLQAFVGLQRASLMELEFTESLLASKKSYVVL
jgi:hypothetical protein